MTAKEQGLPELLADLLSVLEAGQEASLPLTWIGLSEQTPEQVKKFLTKAVDCTVEDGVFTGEVHGIAEAETDRVVAITGCGPKGAANAKHLIWCAHFVHNHKATLAALASDTGERGATPPESGGQGADAEGVMFGKMDSADFEADTITFTMEPGYYAAAGRYRIVPALAQGGGNGR